MNLNSFWIQDPKDNNKPSVTLTLTILTAGISLIMGILSSIGRIHESPTFLNMFWGSLATYLGRRISALNTTFGVDSAPPKQEG